MTIHVRTEGDPAALSRAIPGLLSRVDSRVPARVRPLNSVMAVALFPSRASAAVLAALGIVGWALTVAGLYGLVSYTVAGRIPEIGVRMALGASPANVLSLLLRDGLAVTFVGLAIGLGIAALATPFLSMFLAGVAPRDALSFGAAGLALALTALAASWGPARRGMRLSPTEALRNE
jgi:ABC-type antimicrobial peptide transport system permease subunit